MEKFWLKSYPPGVPAEINPEQYRSLAHLFDESCARYADRAAYSNFGRTITFRQLNAMSRAFGAWLQKEARLKRGDRIALMMPNILQYPVALFGALRAGLTIVNTNPLYTHRELEHQLKDSGAKAIVVFENAAHLLDACLDQTDVEEVIVTGIGDLLGFPKGPLVNFVLRNVRKQVKRYALPQAHSFQSVLEQGKWVNLEDPGLAPQDVAFLQYTGGTTGVSKGAVLTHRNMVANTLQTHAWLGQFPSYADRQQIIVGALPLYHIFALTSIALVWLHEGGHNVLITNPRDLPAFIKDLKRYSCSVYYGVNTLFNSLLNAPAFAEVDFLRIVSCVAGGMALQGAVAERWKALTGSELLQGWGLTETSPVATTNPLGVDFNNSIGLPVPSTEISIRDDSGRELDINQVGEICVRGPQVMRGYWNRPDESAHTFGGRIAGSGAGPFLRTGDLGFLDNGELYVTGRIKHLIIIDGRNLYDASKMRRLGFTYIGIGLPPQP